MGLKTLTTKDDKILNLDECKVLANRYLVTDYGVYELCKTAERPNLADLKRFHELKTQELSTHGNLVNKDNSTLSGTYKEPILMELFEERLENLNKTAEIDNYKCLYYTLEIMDSMMDTFEITLEECIQLHDAMARNGQIIVQGGTYSGKTMFVKMLQKLRSCMVTEPVLFKEISEDGDLLDFNCDVYNVDKDIRITGLYTVENLLSNLEKRNHKWRFKDILVIDEFDKLFSRNEPIAPLMDTSISNNECVITTLSLVSVRGDESATSSNDYSENIKGYFNSKGVELTDFKVVRLSDARGTKPKVSILV